MNLLEDKSKCWQGCGTGSLRGCWCEDQKSTTLSETALAASQNVKYHPPCDSAIPLRHLSKKKEDKYPQKRLTHECSGIRAQTWKQAKCHKPGKRINLLCYVHPTDTTQQRRNCGLDDEPRHRLRNRKATTLSKRSRAQEFILNDSVYMTVPTRQDKSMWKKSEQWLPLNNGGRSGGLTGREHKETFGDDGNVLYHDSSVGDTAIRICQNSSNYNTEDLCISQDAILYQSKSMFQKTP